MDTLGEQKRFWQMGRKFLCILLIVGAVCLLSACGDKEGSEVFENIQGADDGGEQAVRAKQVGKSCWVCPLFKLGFETSEQVYKELVPKVASSAVPLLGVLFGLWLAIRIWKLIGSMKEPDAAAFWKDLATQVFWLAMGAALLKNIMWVVSDIVEPVFIGFVDFGVAVVSSLPIPGGNISCPQGSPQSAFICLLTAMQEKLNVGQDISLVSMIFGDFVMIVMGAGGYIMSIIMGMYFPLLLMDGVFRYAMMLCFLPLGIVGLCFPVSRKFTGKIVDALISIGLQIVGLSIFVAMAAGVLNKYINDYAPLLKNPMGFINNIKELQKFMDGSPGLIGFIFVCFFLVLFAGVIMDIMAQFGGLSPSNVMGGAVMAMRNLAKQGQKVAQFGLNRKNRIQDRQAKKTLEAAKNGGKVDAQKLSKAKERLEDRGYLKKDKNGKLSETQAYKDMDKRGARAFLGRVQRDLQSSGGNQTAGREDDRNRILPNSDLKV